MGTVLSHNVELFLSFLGPVYFIGFGVANLIGSRRRTPSSTRTDLGGAAAAKYETRAQTYAELSKDIKFAPPSWLFGVVWFILYTLMAIGAYIVRHDGGMYVSGVNLASLVYFWILQLLLALWTIVFFGLEQRVLGMIIVFIDLVLSIVVGVLFLDVSVWAAVFMFIVAAWLLFAFFLSLAIVFKHANARRVVNRLGLSSTIAPSVDASLEEGKRRSTAQRTKLSAAAATTAKAAK